MTSPQVSPRSNSAPPVVIPSSPALSRGPSSGMISGLEKSPRRPGQARTMAKPPDIKGGVKTLGFYLLNNVLVEHFDIAITLTGPILDHKLDWDVQKKVLHFESADEAKVWVKAIMRAVTHESSYEFIQDVPLNPGVEVSPLAGSIQFVKRSPYAALREATGDSYTYGKSLDDLEGAIKARDIMKSAADSWIQMYGPQ